MRQSWNASLLFLMIGVFSVLSVNHPSIIADECNTTSNAEKSPQAFRDPPPCACPQFPLYSDPFGTLYYCDRFPEQCYVDGEAAYLFGEYAWPYEECHEDCIGEAFRKNAKEEDQGVCRIVEYTGIRDYVSAEYVHRWERGNNYNADDWIPGQEEGMSCIPPGPGRRSTAVTGSHQMGLHVMKKASGSGTADLEAKCKIVQFTFSRNIALGLMIGNDPTQDKEAKKYYVAFEMDPNTSTSELTMKPAYSVSWRQGQYAFRCRADIDGDGSTEPILVLLYKGR